MTACIIQNYCSLSTDVQVGCPICTDTSYISTDVGFKAQPAEAPKFLKIESILNEPCGRQEAFLKFVSTIKLFSDFYVTALNHCG